MQFKAIALSLFVSMAAAQSVCFDAGDCLLNGGGQCVKGPTDILGKCAGSATATTLSTVTSGSGAAATGSICFDDGDCLLSGGKCVKSDALSITGNCS